MGVDHGGRLDKLQWLHEPHDLRRYQVVNVRPEHALHIIYVTVYAKTRHLSRILIFGFLPAFSS